MIWLSGRDKFCTFVNQPWVDFGGRSMEEELGNGWAKGLHLEDAAQFYTTYASSFDARRSFRMEGRFRRAVGEYRWILVNGVPLYKRKSRYSRRIDHLFSTKSTGRGLGLAVVESIVRSLGGTIGLESVPGESTSVRVSFPCFATDSKAVHGTTSRQLSHNSRRGTRRF